MIEARSLTKKYAPDGPPALDGVDLALEPGAHVALVGPSGSGKSTLLNLLGGLDRPTDGTLLIGDTELATLDEEGLTRWRGAHVGVVFQSFQLLPSLSLVENVHLPMDLVGRIPRAERDARARALLAQVGLQGLEDRLPSEVSGGQQQRAAIARALANDPELLLADEPTGNLDSASAEGVLDVLDGLVERGRTVVVVTHDPVVAGRARVRMAMRDGRFVSDEQ